MSTYKSKTTDDYIKMFKNDMQAVIDTWKGYEEDYYKNIVVPNTRGTIYSNLLMGGQPQYPRMLYQEIVLHNPQVEFSPQKLEQAIKKGMAAVQAKTVDMKKGESFEDFLANVVRVKDDDFLNLFPERLKHTGPMHAREDFALTKTYTLDVKYSRIQDDSRFRNIIKDWGSRTIKDISDIEEGIIRSIYSAGASHGRYLPQNTSITNLGIYDLITNSDGSKTFEEIKRSRYLDDFPDLKNKRGKTVKIPNNRKVLIFLFNSGGYWTSECLDKVVKWAAGRMKELSFKNSKKDKNGKIITYSPKQFWKFSKASWEDRMLFYGSSK